ncbi:12454_t:CDS:2 [Entrophospora sp. SA101]|nr:12454_t:CDS:2 [Entrophospora sp. SA101]
MALIKNITSQNIMNDFKTTTIICGSIIIAGLSYFLSKTSSLSLSSSLSKSPSRNDCKIIQDHTDLFPVIKPILNTSIEELNQRLSKGH